MLLGCSISGNDKHENFMALQFQMRQRGVENFFVIKIYVEEERNTQKKNYNLPSLSPRIITKVLGSNKMVFISIKPVSTQLFAGI